MGAFLKMQGVEGESNLKGYEGWVILKSANTSIVRTIPPNAKGHQREQGSTVPGRMVLVRGVDKSTVKLEEKCAEGRMIPEVQIHFTSMINGENKPLKKFTLRNVIVASHSFSGQYEGDTPSEEIQLDYDAVDWAYTVYDKGSPKGDVTGRFSPKG